MIDAAKLVKNSVRSGLITFTTNKSVPTEACINPYKPFKGTDGKNYLIGYDRRLYTTTNCYAFAMGWQVAGNKECGDYNPGFLMGQRFSMENCREFVQADLEAVGRTVYEILYDIPEKLTESEGYWIKCLACLEKGDSGIHFMRKDKKSGRWIHKMGWEMPPKVCVRNLEFKSRMDLLMESPEMKGVSKEMIESMLKMMIPKQMYAGQDVIKSTLETDDSADYIALPDGGEPATYKTLWVMRISEP